MNSVFYPFIDPITQLPVIDPGIMAQLDPNRSKGDKFIYEDFEKAIFENSKNNNKLDYDLNDYYNPLNYDLYYRSMYQMYPQMNDYYKKIEKKEQLLENLEKKENPIILINNSIFDPKKENKLESQVFKSLAEKEEIKENKKNKK